jgi:PAP2 (acid phosphatase) superfamily protein
LVTRRRRDPRPAIWPIGAALLALALVWPEARTLDLGVSALFYRSGTGFWLDQNPWIQAVYRGVPWLIGISAASLLVLLTLGTLDAASRWRRHRRGLLFLLLSLAIGPGLVSNTLLKNQLGRPRPTQIATFGGAGHYVPPGVPSEQCPSNCSFVCGHCAAAFWLLGLAWIDRRRRVLWWAIGLTFGVLVSAVRIAQGGHFLSDAIGALLVVWACNALLFRLVFGARSAGAGRRR